MEHRWGERVAVRLPVELSGGFCPPTFGSLENVSSSGAFIRARGTLPPRGPVEVRLAHRGGGRGRSLRLVGYIVRETEDGVAIEWREFAPLLVRELLDMAAHQPHAAKHPVKIDTLPRRCKHHTGLTHPMLNAVTVDSPGPDVSFLISSHE